MRITGIRDVKAHFRATLSLVYNHKYEAKRMKRAFGLILKHKEDVVIRKRPVSVFVVVALNWTPTWCLGGHRFESCRWLRSWHADYFIFTFVSPSLKFTIFHSFIERYCSVTKSTNWTPRLVCGEMYREPISFLLAPAGREEERPWGPTWPKACVINFL